MFNERNRSEVVGWTQVNLLFLKELLALICSAFDYFAVPEEMIIA